MFPAAHPAAIVRATQKDFMHIRELTGGRGGVHLERRHPACLSCGSQRPPVLALGTTDGPASVTARVAFLREPLARPAHPHKSRSIFF